MVEIADFVKGEMSGSSLITLLRSVESRCLAKAVGIPRHAVTEKSWDAVLFSIAGRAFAAHMQEISEILNNPASITKVPGTHSWMVGIANVRGNLLPIVDLEAFLFHRHNKLGRRCRVLVVKKDKLYSGLLVDPFVGIQRFRPSERLTEHIGLPKTVEKYVEGVYEREQNRENENTREIEKVKEIWPIFSINRLIESEEFLNAAA